MSDDPMRRTPGVTYEPDDYADVEGFAADYALDAAEAGVDPEAVAQALRYAADEVEYQARVGNIDTSDANDDGREEPTRSEPADFGGGETTGVQDL